MTVPGSECSPAGEERRLPVQHATLHPDTSREYGHSTCARAAERARALPASAHGVRDVAEQPEWEHLSKCRVFEESRAFVRITGRGHHGKRGF